MILPPEPTHRTLRRRLLVALLTLVAWIAGGPRRARALAATAAAAEPEDDAEGRTPHRWAMAIDLDRCTGCGACVVACRVENNVPQLGPEERMRGADIYWMDLLPLEKPGAETGVPPDMIPLPCMQCDNAPCVKVCPVGATYQTGDGIVAQIYDRCIGCRFCQVACPYGRRHFNWTDPPFPDSHVQYLNPDVSVRARGVVEKCNFCQHRVRALLEETRLDGREPRDEELQRLPACAQSCPASAITFGDLDDADSLVARQKRSPRASRLLEHVGTEPRVWYLAKDRF